MKYSCTRGISDGRRRIGRGRKTQDVPILRFLSTSLVIISSSSVISPFQGRTLTSYREHHCTHIDTMAFLVSTLETYMYLYTICTLTQNQKVFISLCMCIMCKNQWPSVCIFQRILSLVLLYTLATHLSRLVVCVCLISSWVITQLIALANVSHLIFSWDF